MGATRTPRPRGVPPTDVLVVGPVPSGKIVLAAVVAVAGLATLWNFGLPVLGVDVAASTSELVHGLGNSTLQIAGALALAAGASRQSGRRRVGWGLIALGGSIGAIGSVYWSAILIRTGEHPFSDLVDGLYATALLLTLAGVAVLPSSELRSRRVRAVDTAILMVAALTLVWVAPVHQQLDGRAIAGFPAVGLAEVITVATILVGVGALARSRPDRHGEVGPIAGALGCSGVGMLLYAASPVGYPTTSRLADLIFAVGFTMAVAAGLRLCGPPKAQRRRGADRGRHWVGLPEVATVTTLVAITLHERVKDTPIPSLMLGTTAVALAIMRLQQLGVEQRRLTRSLHESADQLYTEARTDTLTGLGNRLALDERLRTSLSRAERTPDAERRPLAVLYVDVDHFKRVNDALGHAVGDGLLAEVGRRTSAVLGPHTYRIGGDEFVAVVEGAAASDAGVLARELLHRFDVPVQVEHHEMRASVSIGFAVWDKEELHRVPDPAELLRRADLALYRCKELGRGRWAAFDPTLAERAEVQHRLRTGLQRAAALDEFEVHLEPVVHLLRRELVGVSARLHWRSAEFGLVGPEIVVPAATDGGLLSSTTAALFAEVDRTLAATRDAHDDPTGTPLWVGVRLSRDELVHPAVGEMLIACLRRPDLDPSRLHVEITEDTVIDDAALEVVAGLRQLGAEVTVERFGTGPSSLLRLSHYPASSIRIDGSFVEGLGRRRGDTVIVQAVADLASELGLVLSADGIDEDFQARRLAELGFTNGRGRLFGERIPRERLVAALSTSDGVSR